MSRDGFSRRRTRRVKLGLVALMAGCGLAAIVGVASSLGASHPIASRSGTAYYAGSVQAPPGWALALAALAVLVGVSTALGILVARALERRAGQTEQPAGEAQLATPRVALRRLEVSDTRLAG